MTTPNPWGSSTPTPSTWGTPSSSSPTPGWGTPSPSPQSNQVPWDTSADSDKPRKWWHPRRTVPQMIVVGLTVILGLSYNYLINPSPVAHEEKDSLAYHLTEYIEGIRTLDEETVRNANISLQFLLEFGAVKEDEVGYKALKNILEKVSVSVPDSPQLTLWGSPAKSKFTWQPLTEPSTLNLGEKATFTIPDYSKIPLDKTVINDLIVKHKLKADSLDYSARIRDVFTEYVSQVDIPTKTIERAPEKVCKEFPKPYGSCRLDHKEGTFWVKTLLDNPEFHAFSDKFSELVASELKIKESPTDYKGTKLKYPIDQYVLNFFFMNRFEVSESDSEGTDGATTTPKEVKSSR